MNVMTDTNRDLGRVQEMSACVIKYNDPHIRVKRL